jgi:hypothetical protein
MGTASTKMRIKITRGIMTSKRKACKHGIRREIGTDMRRRRLRGR